MESQLGIEIEVVTRTEDVFVSGWPKEGHTAQRAIWGGFSSTVIELSTEAAETDGLSQHALAQLLKARLKEQRMQNGMGLDSIDLDGSFDELCRVLETGVHRARCRRNRRRLCITSGRGWEARKPSFFAAWEI